MKTKKTKSPADILASKKQWRRQPCNKRPAPRKSHWMCRIREVRESKRLAMRDVAKAVDMSVTTLFQIEKGTDPMLSTAMKLAAFFAMDVVELWAARKENKKV
jgi:DNA-binding XRE family transcriptional regulator